MTRAEAEKLRQRKRVLIAHFNGRRSVIVCLLAPEGVRENEYSKEVVDLTLDGGSSFPVTATSEAGNERSSEVSHEFLDAGKTATLRLLKVACLTLGGRIFRRE